MFSQLHINLLGIIFFVQHHQGNPLVCGKDDPTLILLVPYGWSLFSDDVRFGGIVLRILLTSALNSSASPGSVSDKPESQL